MKILVHATLYPEGVGKKRANTTLFMHTYAAEWVRQGHQVLVIHHRVLFPKAMVAIGRRLLALPGMARAREFLDGYGDDPDADLVIDGVPVLRRAMYKLAPRSLFPRRLIRKRAALCREILARRNFRPDAVVCDFINPGLFVALEMDLKPIAAVLHRTCMEYFARRATARGALDAIRHSDMVAFRSGEGRRKFEARYFKPARGFLMPSGVPASRARPESEFTPRTGVRKFLCVARLTARKHVSAVVRAFGAVDAPGATLTIVGDGDQRELLADLAARQPNAAAIEFAGQLTREQVLARMADCDCFALVSERETFGMAYVEAMSTGAIPIGSVGEGIADIIDDGVNGLLSPAGDAAALEVRMRQLIALPAERVAALSRRAFDTTHALRDDLLAAAAIENLCGCEQAGRLQENGDAV
ncbi:MAG: glycosyltransferase family 4 protein [Clostridiales bacterium]|nr:glycosyltransferase family 4 protein [Clostridiales bacterium]